MADRLFAALLLAVIAGYTLIAFTAIRAPFQYDPLGPESWPRIIGLVALPCCLFILVRPDVGSLGVTGKTLGRLAALLAMLAGYAFLFQPLGFIGSTALFCIALSLMLGAQPLKAVAFGVVAGVGGYFLCTELLQLNLPAGVLRDIL